MIVVLNTTDGPVGIQSGQVKSIVPNADDTRCTITFSDTHSIEVEGSLAKVKGKLQPEAKAPVPEATAPPPETADGADETPTRTMPSRRPRS